MEQERGNGLWHGTLKELIELIRRDTKKREMIADNAAKRIDKKVTACGTKKEKLLTGTEVERYDYFEKELFDKAETTDQLMRIIKGASKRGDIGKRIILMVGPPGGGKSTYARLLRRSLEGVGAFGIKNCPWRENPFKAIPEDERRKLETELEVPEIQGDMCTWCISAYEGKKWEEILVEEYEFSERKSQGIAMVGTTRNPQDVDISELVGAYDISKSVKYSKRDPEAYDCGGALFYADGGVLDVIEMLQLDAKFHQTFLTVCEERMVKLGRFPATTGLNMVIIAHTNEGGYKKFLVDESAEGLRRRVVPVEVPHVLNWKAEKKIYEKLLAKTNFKHVCIAPYSLEMAAKLAVLTRYVEDEKVSFAEKLKLYAGEKVKDVDIKIEDVVKAGKEAREGMFGVAPTTINDAINMALSQPGRKCLFGLDLLDEIVSFLKSGDATRKDRPQRILEAIPGWIEHFREEYIECLKKDVNACFIEKYKMERDKLFRNYLEGVMDFVAGKEISEKREKKALRKVEEIIGISDSGKKDWRFKISAKKGSFKTEKEQYNPDNYPDIKKAVEEKLLKDTEEIRDITLVSDSVEEKLEQEGRRSGLVQKLIEEKKYCEKCAERAVEKVADIYREEES